MDPRRHLSRYLSDRAASRLFGVACAGLLLAGFASLTAWVAPSAIAAPPGEAAEPLGLKALPVATVAEAPPPAPIAQVTPTAPPAAPPRPVASMAPIPNPPAKRPATTTARRAPVSTPAVGRAAIAVANRNALAVSQTAGFVGGAQVFTFDPGQVFEVWTAPLRVTTLTLAPGETIVSKAAGDTVRWQIGETASGAGAAQRTHVMIKPIAKGLETNLVIATNQRVYQLLLRSGSPESFNTVVTWTLSETEIAGAIAAAAPTPTVAQAKTLDLETTGSAVATATPATPAGPLDARYRIAARGKAPAWTPTAVMTDGVRTFLAFPPTLAHGEAPALFVRGGDGEVQLVNYRQQSGLWIVDRVVEQGELRLGDRPRDVVHFVRLGGQS